MTLRSSLRWLVAIAALAVWAPTAAAQSIVINEVYYDVAADLAGDANNDGVRGEPEDEFIEIVNTGATAVDISGFTLSDDDGGDFAFPSGTSLAAGQAAVLFGGGTPTGTFGGALVFTDDGSIGSGLGNSGDLIELRNASGGLVASMGYEGAGSDGSATDESLTRDPDLTGAFTAHSGASGAGGALFSPGTQIDGSAFGGGGSSSDIVISEIDADTPGNDVAEFIELYNTTGAAIDLDAYVLVLYNGSNDASYGAYDLTGSLAAGDFFVVCGDAANVDNCDLEVSPSSNLVQNGADAVALYIGDAANFPNDSPITTSGLVDAVVYDTNDGDDSGLLSGLGLTTQWNEDEGGDKDNESNQRSPSADSDDFVTSAPTPGAGPGMVPPPPPPPSATIAEARALPRGTPVTLTGTVSRAEGAFTYFQDDTAGLAIRQTSGAFADDVASGLITAGTVIEVEGELTEFNNFTQVNGGDLNAYTILSQGAAPAAQTITLQDIRFNGESYESEFVRVEGVQVRSNTMVFEAATTYDAVDRAGIETDIRVPSASDTRVEGERIPVQGTYSGPLGQFSSSDPNNGYQLLLIDPADIAPEVFVPQPETIDDLATARNAGVGSTVTTQGVVTRAEGAFLYIQDETAGLAIRQPSGLLNQAIADGDVAPGTVLKVTGELSTFNGLLQINDQDLASYEIVGTDDVPAPQVITQAQLSQSGEAYESELVQIADATIAPDGDTVFSASTTYAFADGTGGDATLRVPNAGDSEIDGQTIPTDPTTLTGIASQFASSGTGGYQLLVIQDGDVADAGTGGGGGGDLVSIADAREAGAGETVTIEGTVTRAMGAFTYVQDGTAGMVIRQSSGDFFDGVGSGSIAPGTTLRLTGTLSEFRELLQINNADLESYEITGTGDVPAAQTVTLAQLAADGEAYESELIQIVDLTVQGSGTFEAATTYGASDGSGAGGAVSLRIPNPDDTSADGVAIPSMPATYVGVVGQFNADGVADAGYQLLLIDGDDIAVTGGTAGEAGPDAALAIEVANPVRGAATVTFSAGTAGTARLAVYDALGRQVAVLADGPVRGDAQTATFDTSALAPGVYVLYLRTDAATATRTVTVVR